MRNKSKIAVALLSAGLLLAAATPSWAASLGVNFLGRGGDSALTPSDVAGVVAQPFWNAISGEPSNGTNFSGTSGPLSDNAGSFTDVKVVYTANDSWNSDGPTVTTDDKLMKGIIKCNPSDDTATVITNGTDRMIFAVTNLPVGIFNVLVYLTANGSLAQCSVNVGVTTYYVEEQNSFAGTFSQVSSTTPGQFVADGNYAQFNAVPSVNGGITITVIKELVQPQVNDGAGVAAIQVVQVSGLPFPANTQACSITTQPSAAIVTAGNTATFTVGVAGPARIQWQKNNADIAGAIGTSYTTPATVQGDSGSTYRAIVYNNINTNTSTTVSLTVETPTLTQGFMTYQRWDNIGNVTGQAGLDVVKALLPGGANPATPSLVTYVAGVNVNDQGIDNFGGAVIGWVKPTVSGNYDFFLTSDDSSELYLNPVAAVSGTNALPNPNVDTPIAYQYGCCNAYAEPADGQTYTTATPIALQAGKLYGLVAIYKEGGGGDDVRVAWRLTTDTTPAAQLKPIASPYVWTMASPGGQTASLTTQPASKTVQENKSVTFKVAATTVPAGGTYGIQWLKNGAFITGANGNSYTISSVTYPGDNGLVFSAQVYTLSGLLTTTNAVLTTVPDTFPPVVAAGAITQYGGAVQVGLTFDEDVNPAGLIPANFTLNGGSGTFTVAKNSLQTYASVLFTGVTGLTPGGSYTVTVQNLADVKGNAITSTNVPFTVGKVGWADTGVPIRPSSVVPVGADGFDILNGGRTEWGTYDEVAVAYKVKTNDFDVQVQVIYAEPSSQWGRVGLHARNTMDVGVPNTDPFSAYAQTHVNPNQSLGGSGVWPASDPIQPGNANANNGHEQNTRLDTGSATSGWGSAGTSPVYPNVWLRLKRVGAVIQGFRSEDGIAWVDQGTVTLTAQTNVMFVGCSLSAETGNIGWTGFDVNADPYDPTYDRLFLAQYRNFADVSLPVAPSGITISHSGANVVLTWTAGVLQSAATISSTFTDVPGVTGTTYTTPASGTQTYYRLRGTN